MALGEVQVSGELLAIIGAAVALGVGMFGSTRWIHKDVERIRTAVSTLEGQISEDMNKLEGRLSEDMNKLEGQISENMNKLEGRLSENMNKLEGRLSEDMNKLEGRLSEDMNKLEGQIRADMNKLEGQIRADMNKLDGRLSGEVSRLDGRLDEIRDEMTAGFRLIADRLTNVGDRLSKVEGVIEGMFWSARNQPDTAKEGAA